MIDKNILTKAFAGAAAAAILAGGLAGCAPEKTKEEKAVDALKEAGLITDKPSYPPATKEDYEKAWKHLEESDAKVKQLVVEAEKLKEECHALPHPAYSASDCHQLLYWPPKGKMPGTKDDLTGKTPEQIGSALDSLNSYQDQFDADIEKLQNDMAAAREEMTVLDK